MTAGNEPAEECLRHTDPMIQALADHTPGAIVIKDMDGRNVLRICSFGVLLACCLTVVSMPVAAAPGSTQLAANADTGPIVVGRISENPKKHYPRLKKLADYLASNLTGLGPTSGAAIFAKDFETLASFFRSGRVDIVSETPFAALRLVEETGAEILLREWKKGVAEYRTVFFVRRDSDINTFKDLVGRTIAFEDEGSTSAFLMPLSVLRREGYDLVRLSSPREAPPRDKIGYAFAGSENNIAIWVATGIADAGVFSDMDWEELGRTPVKLKKDLRIFFTTEPIIRSVVVVRGDMPAQLKDRIKNVPYLSGLHPHPLGLEWAQTGYRGARHGCSRPR